MRTAVAFLLLRAPPLSTGVRFRPARPYLIKVNRGIMITVTDKSALLAFVNANRQGHLLPMAAFAASLTRVSGVHSFKLPASVFSFAFRYCEKLPPGHVKNSLCKIAVPHHPANLQVFDGDPVKAFDQFRRLFVVNNVYAPSVPAGISARLCRELSSGSDCSLPCGTVAVALAQVASPHV